MITIPPSRFILDSSNNNFIIAGTGKSSLVYVSSYGVTGVVAKADGQPQIQYY